MPYASSSRWLESREKGVILFALVNTGLLGIRMLLEVVGFYHKRRLKDHLFWITAQTFRFFRSLASVQ